MSFTCSKLELPNILELKNINDDSSGDGIIIIFKMSYM